MTHFAVSPMTSPLEYLRVAVANGESDALPALLLREAAA